jgi:hypothetical protein
MPAGVWKDPEKLGVPLRRNDVKGACSVFSDSRARIILADLSVICSMQLVRSLIFFT